jgi:hypothetical protein
MLVSLLILTFAVQAAEDETPRKPSAIAPSLRAITPEEEEKLDGIVDRFMLADTGRLRGVEAKQAVREFEALQPEAIPALIRGLNKAARMEHSCPVLMITKKLNTLLLGSNDQQLLEYARDEIGAGVGRSRYAGTLQELRFKVLMRKNALARLPASTVKPLREMSTIELSKAVGTERGSKLRAVLTELEQRKGKEVLAGLSVAASSTDRETQKAARDLLDRHLSRQGEDFIKEQFTGAHQEVRRSAVRAAAKFPALTVYAIDLLSDDNPEVQAEAHDALVRQAKGEDFGPTPGASAEQRKQAQAKWREWAAKN